MFTYVTLYKFTDQGLKNIKESPERLKAGIKAAEAIGGRLIGAYYTMGEYDLVVISEITDEQAGMAHTLGNAMLGNVRTMSMRAFTPEEFGAILAKLP